LSDRRSFLVTLAGRRYEDEDEDEDAMCMNDVTNHLSVVGYGGGIMEDIPLCFFSWGGI